MDYVARLPEPLPPELVRDFLAKLHYVAESLAGFEMGAEERDLVRFRLRRPDEGEAARVAARIAEAAAEMGRGFRPIERKVLASRRDRPVPFGEDPHPLLAARGELVDFGPGRLGLGPLPVALLDFFDREVARLAAGFGAEPYRFPSLIGAAALDRCKYLRTFPHALTLACHLREDLEAIRGFAREARVEDGRLAVAPEHLAAPECLLAPTVCFHLWAALQDSRQGAARTITAAGRCFRYESGNLSGLERLWDFTMREVIFLGAPEVVLAGRERLIAETTALFDEWGLAFEIHTATDPFFIEGYSLQTTFQAAFDLKFELSAPLPYSGGSVALGSFNYHQDFFGRSFGIADGAGEPVHTACIGFGLERLVLAFLAQHGLDRAAWPPAVRAGVEPALGA